MSVPVTQRRRYRGRTRATMQSALRHLQNLVSQSDKAAGSCQLVPPLQRRNVLPAGLLLNVDIAQLQVCILILQRNLATLGVVPSCLDI